MKSIIVQGKSINFLLCLRIVKINQIEVMIFLKLCRGYLNISLKSHMFIIKF